ncbi:hypothetical protein MSG28_010238 [Choristoneura fumiferana]|uniref:Uncharacterized protein n=1 Tax=Choristoneura fumiferana TaxID=7141 RepID=A0ACC0KL11_CHOFU|nr:hypothetical protein MSG28_010238 [Choristoneura fumiferana]
MKFQYLCLLLAVLVSQLWVAEAYPFRRFRPGNIDYMEALRRMQQIPQWHCMRYRRFQPHGPCSRWWLMRRT